MKILSSGFGPPLEPNESHTMAMARVAKENNESLWKHLRDDLGVPEAMKALAIRIWWDGKED